MPNHFFRTPLAKSAPFTVELMVSSRSTKSKRDAPKSVLHALNSALGSAAEKSQAQMHCEISEKPAREKFAEDTTTRSLSANCSRSSFG